ncbi:segregation and condensation protein A [Nitrosomonas sp.]|uniref:segregation and condensation protein A n=1 Tax=Nitrosomonas sp. TaxID=42353 RepID=UPI001D757EF4|nr:segregation/condensation protein A [Nitrosomonas sp.]MBX3615641.1 segregation/condensation protein A [Nitrosomonas sp.]
MVNPVIDSLESQSPQPIARICGEPLLEIPQDLYIPPDALEVFLDTFQGPLDLLLYLIRKHNLNILDIPMAELTQQYMTYVEMMRIDQLELAAEYLLMTALLIEIKSRMLLPKSKTEIAEESDPRAELVRRLLEYEQIKKAADRLNRLPQAERDFSIAQIRIEQNETIRLPNVNSDDLRNAWIAILTRAKVNRHHQVKRETLSVRAYMSQVLRDLRTRKQLEFYDLFSPAATIMEVVVTFLAVLELAKELLLEISQSQDSGTIYVRAVDVA